MSEYVIYEQRYNSKEQNCVAWTKKAQKAQLP